jgi:hypothetical protein
MKYVVTFLAALALVLSAHSVGRADAPAGVQRWEYKMIAVTNQSSVLGAALGVEASMTQALEKELAKGVSALGYEVVDAKQFRTFLTDAGAAGWDLVSVDDMTWIFKRPLK